ncbi:MAG: ankyrin repeat domain-containing protein [Acidobacteriota bacterium]
MRVLAAFLLVLWGFGDLHAQEDNADAAVRRGEKALAENRLDDAITAFQRCLQMAPRASVCACDLACAYSLKGDARTAVEWLARAADWGYEEVDWMLQTTYLTNARSDVRFGQLIEDIQSRFPDSRNRPYVAPNQPERGMELVAMVRSELGSGAAIVLSHEGNRVYLATANHVVRQGGTEAQTVSVQLKALGPRWRSARLQPAVGDADLDFAVLSVDGTGLNVCALPLHLGGDSGLHRGDAVYPVGYPGGILWAMPLTPDHASQVSPSQISFESQFVRVGFSGGALLNERGEIVGMITADEPPLGRAVPLALILQAARAAGYPVQLSGPEERAKMPLHVAAKAGDVAAIKRLLENCADPNLADATGRTALHEAAVQGSVETIQLLLNGGARLHAWAVIRGDDSKRVWATPLHLAAEHGRVEAVKAFLVHGDVNVETLVRYDRLERWNTPLHFAARHDRGDVAEVLVAAGAHLEAIGWHDLTPLGVAARSGSVSVARVLIRHGAAMQPRAPERDPSLLQVAAEAGMLDMLKLLIDLGADVNQITSWQYSTALAAAAAGGQDKAAEFLIAQKAVVDEPSYGGNTPLHSAARTGSAAVAKVLVANGADPNRRNARNESPLTLAAEREDLEILRVFVNAKADTGYLLHRVLYAGNIGAARILIEGGADVALKDKDSGESPLHMAAKKGLAEAVDLLIAAKAEVNEPNGSGWTALYLAVAERHVDVVDRLLRAGADPNSEVPFPPDENTPVARAASKGPPEMLALLLAAGGDPNRRGKGTASPLYLAARGRDSMKKVQLLLKAGARVVAEGDGASPLHAAMVADGEIDGDHDAASVIRVLLAAGAVVDATDENGLTPLHHAASRRNIEVVKLLLSGGASVQAVAKCGATPLSFVLQGARDTEDQALAVAEILVAAGADVNATDSCSNKSLMDVAQELGNYKVRQLLLSKGAKSGGHE